MADVSSTPANGRGVRYFVSYTRVSTDEQKKNTSPKEQFKKNWRYAEANGIAFIEELADDCSGTIPVEDRPKGRKVYELLRSGRAAGVVMPTIDRAARGKREYPLEFLKFLDDILNLGAELHFADSGKCEGNVLDVIRAHFAGSERNKINDRMTSGRRARAEEGFPTNAVPRFYRTLRDERGRRTGYEFDRRYQAFFNRMARLFLSHLPYDEMAKRLGRNPATGTRLQAATVRYMLINPVFRGVVIYRRRSIPGGEFIRPRSKVPPAWDVRTCAAIEREHARRHRLRRSVGHKSSFLFAGILRCGYCGYLMSGHSGRAYQCHRGRLIRGGYIEGKPHPPNNISERRMLRLLRDTLAGVTAADMDEFLDRLELPHGGQSVVDPDEISSLERRASELQDDAERVSSASARALLERELRQVSEDLARLKGLEEKAATDRQAVDRDEIRRLMLELQALLQADHVGFERLRGVIRAALPALYLKGGRLVSATERE